MILKTNRTMRKRASVPSKAKASTKALTVVPYPTVRNGHPILGGPHRNHPTV